MPETIPPRHPVLQGLVTMLRQWWDTDYIPEGAKKMAASPDRVDWTRCVPFISTLR